MRAIAIIVTCSCATSASIDAPPTHQQQVSHRIESMHRPLRDCIPLDTHVDARRCISVTTLVAEREMGKRVLVAGELHAISNRLILCDRNQCVYAGAIPSFSGSGDCAGILRVLIEGIPSTESDYMAKDGVDASIVDWHLTRIFEDDEPATCPGQHLDPTRHFTSFIRPPSLLPLPKFVQ